MSRKLSVDGVNPTVWHAYRLQRFLGSQKNKRGASLSLPGADAVSRFMNKGACLGDPYGFHRMVVYTGWMPFTPDFDCTNPVGQVCFSAPKVAEALQG